MAKRAYCWRRRLGTARTALFTSLTRPGLQRPDHCSPATLNSLACLPERFQLTRAQNTARIRICRIFSARASQRARPACCTQHAAHMRRRLKAAVALLLLAAAAAAAGPPPPAALVQGRRLLAPPAAACSTIKNCRAGKCTKAKGCTSW